MDRRRQPHDPDSRHHDVASDGGAEHWAILASLIETSKLCGVEPLVYLTDVITKIVNGHQNNRLDELLPWAFIKADQIDRA